MTQEKLFNDDPGQVFDLPTLEAFRSGRRETTPYLTVSDTETGSEGKSTTRALKPQNLAL